MQHNQSIIYTNKLFVITIIGEDGKIDKKELPIFDNSFGETPMFELLKQYLKALNISQVKQVQCVADGALWTVRRCDMESPQRFTQRTPSKRCTSKAW